VKTCCLMSILQASWLRIWLPVVSPIIMAAILTVAESLRFNPVVAINTLVRHVRKDVRQLLIGT
jgi:hypothetical protein